jgi:MFS family permease
VIVLLPVIAVVFVAYLVMGLAMPVLPVHVHRGLRLRPFAVGIVVGSQFAAALVSRVWAGHYADSRGAKCTVVVGLMIAVGSGLPYVASLGFADSPGASAAVLVLGRAVLGVAESLIITGALS